MQMQSFIQQHVWVLGPCGEYVPGLWLVEEAARRDVTPKGGAQGRRFVANGQPVKIYSSAAPLYDATCLWRIGITPIILALRIALVRRR